MRSIGLQLLMTEMIRPHQPSYKCVHPGNLHVQKFNLLSGIQFNNIKFICIHH